MIVKVANNDNDLPRLVAELFVKHVDVKDHMILFECQYHVVPGGVSPKKATEPVT